MPDLAPVSPDLPELRLLAQLAGIAPTRLAAAFNDPRHFEKNLTREEGERLTDAMQRFKALLMRPVDVWITPEHTKEP